MLLHIYLPITAVRMPIWYARLSTPPAGDFTVTMYTPLEAGAAGFPLPAAVAPVDAAATARTAKAMVTAATSHLIVDDRGVVAWAVGVLRGFSLFVAGRRREDVVAYITAMCPLVRDG